MYVLSCFCKGTHPANSASPWGISKMRPKTHPWWTCGGLLGGGQVNWKIYYTSSNWNQTEMSLSIVRSPGIFFSCFSYGVQSIFWGGPFVSSFSFFSPFGSMAAKPWLQAKRNWAELNPSGRHKIGWDTNHKWSHKKSYDSNDPEWVALIFFQNLVLKSM